MEISTSLLSVKKEDIIQTIYNLEVAHTDYFHIDVMDGRFVENDTSETMRIYCEYLNQVTNVPKSGNKCTNRCTLNGYKC